MCRMPLAAAFVTAIVTVASLSTAHSEDRPAAAADIFTQQVQPLFETYCYDCHSGTKPEGSLRLNEFRSAAALQEDRQAWEKVLSMLRGREMPPEDAEQPPETARKVVVEWIDATLNDIDCTGTPDPGRVTIRRLNRVEYQNTIRDLLGIEFQATAEFPADDVGYGFDNIGDVLSLPPMLMEKYFSAAEQIADRAIVTNPLEAATRTHFDGGHLKTGSWFGRPRDGAASLNSHGELYVDHLFPHEGEYLIRTRASGDQAGDEPARMRLSVDGKPLHEFDVKAERAQPADYDWRMRLTAGKHRVAVEFMNDYYKPDAADPGQRDRNLHVVHLELIGPVDIGPDAYPESHRRIFIAEPGGDISPEQATREVLRRLASRAFRRPVSDEELQRLARLAASVREQGDGFEQSIQYALVAMLISPQFLFRIEQDPQPNTPDTTRPLDDYELATRLSYFLWSSMPDDELFRAAAAGEVRNKLDSQVRRMLADPKSSALVENFALQWLELRHLADFAPDRGLFPMFDDKLRTAMLTEARLLFEHVLREDRSVLELVDADYTFVNGQLARHYGIANVAGDDFRRVSLASSPRGGVITLAAVLAATSNPTRTSPVKRGKWILENILGTPPPDPPPDVPQLSEDRRAALTASLRERLEEHRSNPQCAVCHRKMDAMGFALENFDAVGAWRTRDGQFDIDSAGELPDGRTFDGPAALKEILKTTSRDEFTKCLTEKMLTYALGRGLERYDQCAVDKITKALPQNDFRYSTLVLEIARSDPFQRRRGKTPE